MSTSTSYMATGTCAAPERGRGLQGWAAFIQQMEVEREIWNVVKRYLKGVDIRPVGAYNSTFAVHINELCLKLKRHCYTNLSRKIVTLPNGKFKE